MSTNLQQKKKKHTHKHKTYKEEDEVMSTTLPKTKENKHKSP
jgi:hypothetical protein